MKRSTASQKIFDLLLNSESGPVMVAFITEAIRAYALVVMDDKEEWKNSIVSKGMWQACAKEILEKTD